MRFSLIDKKAIKSLHSWKIGVVSNHSHLLIVPRCFEKSAFQEKCPCLPKKDMVYTWYEQMFFVPS